MWLQVPKLARNAFRSCNSDPQTFSRSCSVLGLRFFSERSRLDDRPALGEEPPEAAAEAASQPRYGASRFSQSLQSPDPLQMLMPVFAEGSPLEAGLEAGRHATNFMLKSLDAPVRVSFHDRRHRVAPDAPGVTGDRPTVSTWEGTTLVTNADIQEYVDAILSAPDSIVNNPWVPDAIERQVYMVVVKLVLQMMHTGIGVLDQRQVFGLTLKMVQSRSKHGLERRDLSLPDATIDDLIDSVVVSPDALVISATADRILYANVIKFALRLATDILASLRLSVFGLKLKIDLQLDSHNVAKLRPRSSMDLKALEASCHPLIELLLKDENFNFNILSDETERRLYHHLMRLIANLAAAAVDMAELDVFGVHAKPDVT